MVEYDCSIIIERPVEEVFDLMQDINREHEWQPNLREAEQIPEGEPGVGTRRRYVSEFMGRRFENVRRRPSQTPRRRVKSSGNRSRVARESPCASKSRSVDF
jgi:hypothetical protein